MTRITKLSRSVEGQVVLVTGAPSGMGRATAGNSPYAAAKHGVIGLTRSLAVEFGKEVITVTCICPGPIRTGMTETMALQVDGGLTIRRA